MAARYRRSIRSWRPRRASTPRATTSPRRSRVDRAGYQLIRPLVAREAAKALQVLDVPAAIVLEAPSSQSNRGGARFGLLRELPREASLYDKGCLTYAGVG